MQPALNINYLAIPVAALASFMLSFLWWGPLFGKKWAELAGLKDMQPDNSAMIRGMLLNLVGVLILCYVLAHSVNVWRPSVWGAGADQPAHIYGFFGGFFVWLGYVVPLQINTVAWEQRSWAFFGINVGGHFISLQAAAMILAFWR